MSSRIAPLLLAIAAVACGGSSRPAPAAPSNDTVAEPAPSPPPPAAEPAPRADGRPEIVTDEMVAIAEDMMVSMDAMGVELAAAGTDCAKGAAALRKGLRAFEPVAERSKAFEEPMKDPAAEAWFKNTYMPRLMHALQPLMTMAQACSNDQDFAAAMKEMDDLDL
jgi:hypothetical protein